MSASVDHETSAQRESIEVFGLMRDLSGAQNAAPSLFPDLHRHHRK